MEFLALLVVLFLWAPAFDSGEGNRCYKVDQEMRQTFGPCTSEMTAGYGRRR